MGERYPRPWRIHPDDPWPIKGRWMIVAADDRILAHGLPKPAAQTILKKVNDG